MRNSTEMEKDRKAEDVAKEKGDKNGDGMRRKEEQKTPSYRQKGGHDLILYTASCEMYFPVPDSCDRSMKKSMMN